VAEISKKDKFLIQKIMEKAGEDKMAHH